MMKIFIIIIMSIMILFFFFHMYILFQFVIFVFHIKVYIGHRFLIIFGAVILETKKNFDRQINDWQNNNFCKRIFLCTTFHFFRSKNI